MKKLNTLILSVALLCPMWAGAQTVTTPSILGPLHYSGGLMINSSYAFLPTLYGGQCAQITDLRLNIQPPNNASPIKGVSGYFNCLDGSWQTFSGALVATITGLPNTTNGLPNTTNATTTGYTGTFTLGLTQMMCTFPADLTQANCQLFAILGANTFPLIIGDSSFYYTNTP
jgi:hypothetical protein